MEKQTKTHFVNNLGNSPYSFFLTLQLSCEIKEEREIQWFSQEFSTSGAHVCPVP
jgi:hypothetical protein